MGNDVKKPTASLIKDPHYFQELIEVKLRDVKDASFYWKQQTPLKARVNKDEFDELFSCVFRDPDVAYDLFGKRNVIVLDVISIITLLCNDTVESKLKFIFELFHEEFKVDCKVFLHRLFQL
jgi:hypothetical protein